jgi:malate synthase
VATAREIFDRIKGPHQIANARAGVRVTAADLLAVPKGSVTEKGLRTNINVGVLYIESWLRGVGCVPLYNLMEDAATAEISRTQVWQWIRHGAKLTDGRVATRELVRQILAEELDGIRKSVGEERYGAGRFEDAAQIFAELATASECPDFLTLAAYDHLD